MTATSPQRHGEINAACERVTCCGGRHRELVARPRTAACGRQATRLHERAAGSHADRLREVTNSGSAAWTAFTAPRQLRQGTASHGADGARMRIRPRHCRRAERLHPDRAAGRDPDHRHPRRDRDSPRSDRRQGREPAVLDVCERRNGAATDTRPHEDVRDRPCWTIPAPTCADGAASSALQIGAATPQRSREPTEAANARLRISREAPGHVHLSPRPVTTARHG